MTDDKEASGIQIIESIAVYPYFDLHTYMCKFIIFGGKPFRATL